jgi:hypothetical protein
VNSFEFKNVLFIGPGDGSEEAGESRRFVGWLIENEIKVTWRPFDFCSELDDELHNELKKVKNILLNSSQIIIDDEVLNWEKRIPAGDLSKKIILAILNEDSFDKKLIKTIESSAVNFVIVKNEKVFDFLSKEKCSKKLILKPKLEEHINSETSHYKNIILGEGWYPLESYQSSTHRWTDSKCIIEIKEKYYDHIEIETFCDYTDREILIEAKENKLDKFKQVFLKKYKQNSLIKLLIPLKNFNFIRISSGLYSPGGSDTRNLGLKINELTLVKQKNKLIKKIFSFEDNHTFIFNQIIKEDSVASPEMQFFDREEPFFQGNYIDKVTVVLTCHGDRLSFGKKSYDSIVDSGFKNIVIVISGCNSSYEKWGESLKQKHEVVIIKDDLNNNLCWAQGVERSKTLWSMILHDDDLLLPTIKKELNYLNEKVSFGCVNGEIEDLKTGQINQKHTVELPFKRGIYSTKLFKDLLKKHPLTISPIHGVFKTKKLLDCLNNWEKKHGKDQSYFKKKSFVVGNDLFIWLEHLKNDELFYASPETCLKCVAHDGSATHSDWQSEKSFIPLYSKLKNLHISKPITSGILFYLQDLDKKRIKCLNNLNSFKKSKYPLESIVFSCNDLDVPEEYNLNFIKINNDDFDRTIPKPRWNKNSAIPFWGFISAIEIALELQWDYFLYYEWDCMIGQDYWYDTLWQQCLSWQQEPYLMGTPIFNYPHSHHSNMQQASLEYRYKYAKDCGLNMLTQEVDPYCLYTNGALTFYKTKIAQKYFQKELSLPKLNRSILNQAPAPWDIEIGFRIFNDIKEKSFNKIGWLPSSYSGCTDTFYNKKQRKEMLDSGMKVAIHQCKYS